MFSLCINAIGSLNRYIDPGQRKQCLRSPCNVSLGCEHTSSAAFRCSDVVVSLSILGLLIGVWTGHSWNDWQTFRRSLSHRRAATLQQELSVVDDPGTFW